MKIIIGLGNPGKKYEKTRHNVGFMVLDEIVRLRRTVYGLRFETEKKFKAEVCQFDKDTLLVKPQTFMNNSGEAVKKVLKYKSIKVLRDLWVIHDDLDLELGRIKIHMGGSSGHHGIESINQALGTSDFFKFRLGIGRPKTQEEIDFLLSPFKKEELPLIEPAIKKMAEAVIFALEEGMEKTMNEFNV